MRRMLEFTFGILEEFGYTNDCKGCESAAAGSYHRDRSQACRERIEEQFGQIEKGRQTLNREKERMMPIAEETGGMTSPNANPSGRREVVVDDASPSASPSGRREVIADEGRHCDPIGGVVADLEEVVAESSVEKSISNIMEKRHGNLCNKDKFGEILKAFNKQIIGDAVPDGKPKNRDTKSDVVEVYSLPRMVSQAIKVVLRAGSSLDLTTYGNDGRVWGFSSREMRNRARKKRREEIFECIVVCLMCGPFGQLQGLNYPKMGIEDVGPKLREAMTNLLFAMELCKWQSKEGRLFAFEHPATATSWKR